MGRREFILLGAVFAFVGLVLLFVFGSTPGRGPEGTFASPTTVASPEGIGTNAVPEGTSEREAATLRTEATTRNASVAQTPGAGADTATGRPSAAAFNRTSARRDAAPGTPEPDAASATEGTAALTLAFVDLHGVPVRGVRVVLRARQRATRATSAGDGVAGFAGLPAGPYSWEADAPGLPPVESARQVLLRDGETQRLTVRLGEHDLTIAGRVLDSAGTPLPGVGVVASLALASLDTADGVVLARPRDRRTLSTENGSYRITGLVSGEYNLHTVETPDRPRATSHVRAGVDSADLVVMVRRMLRVTGVVNDERGVPIEGVGVHPVAALPKPITTDKEGRYELELDVSKTDRVHALRFSKPGYRDQRIELPREATRTVAALTADAVLHSEGETIRVSGIVESTNGDALPRQRVELNSQVTDARYRAETDDRGRFELPNVRAGVSYRVRIWPSGNFRDYSKDLGVLTRDEPRLEIALEPFGTATLSGTIMDAEGVRLPGFDLWLRSRSSASRSTRITSDEAGRFRAEGVAEGEIFFETRSAPFLRSEGYRVRERDDVTLAPIIVDWGEREVRGHALGKGGDPLARAVVLLTWSQSRDGKTHSARRTTQTAADGSFRFSRLGPGEHQLILRATGYRTLERRVEAEHVPRDLEIRMKPES